MIRAFVLLLVIGGAVIAAPGGVVGQEVAGDVMIPPPRELATSTSAASGLGMGRGTSGLETMAAYRTAVENVVAQVRSGTMSESEAREQVGDVIVSLLIKAGVMSFRGGGALGEASSVGVHGGG